VINYRFGGFEMKVTAELIESGKFLHEHGLVIGSGGNISAREADFFVIKKSGVDMSRSGPSDYSRILLSSDREAALPGSSSEIFIHWDCYLAREDVRAVAHAHPPYSVAVSRELSLVVSPSYEFDCIVGEAVPVVDFIEPGSRCLGEAVAEKVKEGNNAVILKRHGVVAVGKDIREACLRVLAVERACMTL
jgi:ribulose-5-phosphate 4-epimerase/fuculose-1-phosphate aldolase